MPKAASPGKRVAPNTRRTSTRTPQRARPRRRLTADARRALIVAAAMEVFAARGYHEATMAEIAAAAGVAPSVLYDHFASKASLQTTLLEQQTDELLASVANAIAAAPDSAGARLTSGVDAFFRFVEEHEYAWRMLFRDPPADAEVLDCHRRVHRRATETIAAFLLAYAPASARRRRTDPQLSAEMFAQLLKEAQNGLAEWWYEHREVPREVLVEHLLEFCWTGLAAGAAADTAPRP